MAITLSAINLKKAVTSALDDYRNKPFHFISDYVAPVVNVPERTGYMPKFTNEHMKLQDFSVSLDGKAHKVDIGTSSTSFTCVDHSAEFHLTKRMMVSDSTGLLKAANISTRVDEGIRLQRENEVATVLTGLSSSTPGIKWDLAGGSPPTDIATYQGTMFSSINRLPRHGLCSYDVGLKLRALCGQAYGRQTSDLPSMEEVAKWMGLDEIRMGLASYDSGKPGKSTTFATLLGTKAFWLFYKPETMDSSLPAFMATTRFAALSQPRVYPLLQPEGFGVEVNDCYDVVSVDTNACIHLANVLK